jgi:wyosine [tRNA(Phe)-imidazoG37] synthetase (radical SAM superfamily)
MAFRDLYSGKLWPEVMLIKDLNDTEEELENIAGILKRIRPGKVHINLPTRPPSETWVQPPDDEGIMRAVAIFGEVASVVHPADGTFDLSGFNNLVNAVVAIITRHPMREEELKSTLKRWTAGEVNGVLEGLENSGKAQIVYRHGCRFWSAAGAFYPDEIQSKTTSPSSIHRQKSLSEKS